MILRFVAVPFFYLDDAVTGLSNNMVPGTAPQADFCTILNTGDTWICGKHNNGIAVTVQILQGTLLCHTPRHTVLKPGYRSLSLSF